MAWTVETIEINKSRPDLVDVGIMWGKGGANETPVLNLQVQSNKDGLARLAKAAAEWKKKWARVKSEEAKLSNYETAILNKLNG